MPEQNITYNIEGADIIFRNFAGRERQYNEEGNRNFHIVLPPDLAKSMLADNWRVKQLQPKDGEDEGTYHIKVTVNYKKGRPPRCVMITSRGRTDLGADEVEILDYADIKNVDVVLNGWYSDMNGGGYSAFLKAIYVTIEEDEFAMKYADLPDAQTPTGESGTASDGPPWDENSEYKAS